MPEMMTIGERNFNFLKLGGAMYGYIRQDDDLLRRFKGPLPRGNSAHEPIPDEDLQEAIDKYYELRGWDEYGPTDAKLIQLDMKEGIGLI